MEKTKNKLKILVVEDDYIINKYIVKILSEYYFNIDSSYDGEEAIEYLKSNKYDIILCDIIMPKKTGFEVLDFIKTLEYKTYIMMISALSQKKDLIKAYQKGAIDYINKPIHKEILISKIKNIENYLLEDSLEISIDRNFKEVLIDGENIKLTRTEFEIFTLLYDNEGMIFSKEDINEKIWFENKAMSNKIIEVNIFNIRKKLTKYSFTIKTKRQVGYYYENKK